MAKEVEPLVEAIANYFDVKMDNMRNFVLIAKHVDPDDGHEIFSSAWPSSLPTDELLGAVSVLRVHTDGVVV